MKEEKMRCGPSEGDCRRLADLLEWEEEHYRRLLRLAWRQNFYMKRQDVHRLEANARDWARHLPAANLAKAARERFLVEMAGRTASGGGRGLVGAFLGCASTETRDRLQNGLTGLRRTVGKLARQNELNRTLSEFCLDLVREETEIFKRCVLENPAGCYGENARNADRGPGGVLVRTA